jgi:hypothetical protein
MNILLLLFIAHCIADFYLQKHSWIMDKVAHHERSIGLFFHVLTHVFLTGLILLWIFSFNVSWMWLGLLSLIVITHYGIDIWKSYQTFKLSYYLIDQCSHIIILCAVSYWITMSYPDINGQLFAYKSILVWIAGGVFLANPMAVTVMVTIMPLRQALHNQDNTISSTPSKDGHYMGIIERLLVMVCVGSGYFVIPGLLYFGKLYYRLQDDIVKQNTLQRRYIVLGTSVSFISATCVGLLINLSS